MTAQPVWLHTSAVDCLADDLLDLMRRIEADLPAVMSDGDRVRVDTTKALIGQVCDVVDRHLFKDGTR